MAWRSTSTAIAGTQPNLRDSGHSAPSPSVSTRQNTRAPGAARAIFSTSSTQSTANRRMPSSIGARDVALLLDGVAEGDAVGRRAGIHRHLDFGNRRGVEGRAHRGEQAQDLRRRVCLHRVVDPGIGKRLLEGAEIVAHDVEVDDEAGAVRTSGGEEIEDALRGHRSLHRAALPRAIRLRDAGARPRAYARWTKAGRLSHGTSRWRPRNHETRVARR